MHASTTAAPPRASEDDTLREPIGFADTDTLLRDDVRRLGALVGDMLAEQGSPGLLEEVEAVRRAAIARREAALPVDELADQLSRIPLEDAEAMVRAFAAYFGAINLAERVHRIRRRRDYQREAAAPQLADHGEARDAAAHHRDRAGHARRGLDVVAHAPGTR